MLSRIPALVALCAALSISTGAQAECTALADAATGKLLKQEGVCDQRLPAASTFKIAISLMGYDSGFLTDEHSPALPFREGYPDWIANWRATTDPTSWMKNSVVWYSQQITQSLGMQRFQAYVTAFQYGNADVSGDPGKNNGLTRSWLSSSLKISPLEQLTFLGKVVRRQLPVSAQAHEMTSRIMTTAMLPNGWRVYGKTGSGAPIKADGSRDETRAFGWFVGWAAKDGRTVVFSRQIQDKKRESVSPGFRARDALMQKLPSILDTL